MVVSRGFFSDKQLAGHDTSAYYITQHQFHENIVAGVLFPRWAPDMRYGYGHPKLQFRPPVFHYFVEPFYAISNNMALSINIAIILFITIAGWGAFFCCTLYMKKPAAMIGAIAYITFNYLLSDLYIRGAYYEVAAYSFIPWILWGQGAIFRIESIKNNVKRHYLYNVALPIAIYGCCWSAIIGSHPQIMVFFIPLSIIHFCFLWNEARNFRSVTIVIFATFAGFMIAAPYWYVAITELPFVRMNLFYSGLESYNHHFISFKELFIEPWPTQYSPFNYFDYLKRPRHTEMRTLNLWIITILIIIPFLWLSAKKYNSQFLKRTIIFYLPLIALIFLTLPAASGVWYIFTSLHTFNFPWRALAVTGICAIFLLGLTIDEIRKRLQIDKAFFSLSIVVVIIMLLSSWHKSEGWTPEQNQIIGKLNNQIIQNSSGIPKQFYTPKWVSDYATTQQNSLVRFISGKGEAKVIYKDVVKLEIDINAKTNAEIAIAQYYYPGWELRNSKHSEIKISPLENSGEISFTIPKGRETLHLAFTNTFNRIFANIALFIGLLLLSTLIFILSLLKCECSKKNVSFLRKRH